MKTRNVNTFSRACLASVFALSLMGCGGADTTTETAIVPVSTTQPVSDWNLVWADEFEGDTLDAGNWTFEVDCLGGGNAERQCYTENPENLFLGDGNLNIVALPATGQAQPYSSARINSAGKADFRYGRIEMRAKLPEGQGSWPAFWMMPTDSVYGTWPRSGEIDIMEAVNLKTVDPRDGSDQRSVYGTLHYGKAFPNNDSSGTEFIFPAGTNPADDFHTYAIEWQEGEIRWYVDDYLYAVQKRSVLALSAGGEVLGSFKHRGWYSEYIEQGTGLLKTFYDDSPFDEDFHLILNLAVGGNWPENVNELGIDADAFTNGQSLVVDYVRVYECGIDPITGKGCETLRPGFDVVNDAGQVVGFDETGPALREGVAPPPATPNVGGGETIGIFDNGVVGDWAINACCDGNSTSQLVLDNGNQVVQFDTTGDAAVTGFDLRAAGESVNLIPLAGDGVLSFDVRVLSQPTSGAGWLVKVESDGQCCSDFAELALADLPEGAPVVGEWKSYTIAVSDLIAAGLEPSLVDAVFVFPGFTTGAGASVQLRNMSFVSASSVPTLEVFSGVETAPWAINACCDGNSVFEIVTEGDGNQVVEFTITGNASVVGFDSRAEGEQFNLIPYNGSGSLKFDVKVISQPTSGAPWLLKVESDGQCCSDFGEIPLADLPEGAPVVGEWKSYSVPVADLIADGLEPSLVDAIFIFPGFTTGAGAVVQFDNVRFEASADAGGGGDNGGDGPGDGGDGETPGVVFQIGQEILSNGSFDTDAEGWTGGMVMADGDNSVLMNLVSTAGDPWSVNTSQVLTIEPATNYTLSFRARASQARSIIAGIGLNAAPFSSDTANVALTTEWQTFTLNLTSLDEDGDPFGDDNSRALFDMGAEVGDVFLDDISLVKSAQLVVNGGFDFDNKEWTATAENIRVEEGNKVYFVDVTSAGDPFAVNLSQVMTLAPSSTYTVEFRAKASIGRTMLAGIGLNAAPFFANVEEVTLSTDWVTYTYTLETIADGDNPTPFGDANSRVLFDMGADVGEVYIDDVTVTLVQADPPAGGMEMVINGSFESGVDPWYNAIADANVIDDNGDQVYFVNVTAAGNPFDVNISQLMTLEPSISYTMTFRAKASVERTMLAGLGLAGAPFYATTETVSLTTNWQAFTYTITTISDGDAIPFGDDNSRVLFDMGAEIGEVYIDDVSVIKQ